MTVSPTASGGGGLPRAEELLTLGQEGLEERVVREAEVVEHALAVVKELRHDARALLGALRRVSVRAVGRAHAAHLMCWRAEQGRAG